MKIGIEGQRLFRINKHGMDLVALELIKNIQKIDTKNEYVIFVKSGVDNSCLSDSTNVKIIEIKNGFFPFWEQILLLNAVKREKCDILHCTSNTAPIFINIPLITTVHDVIYLEYCGLFSKSNSVYQKFGNLYRRLIVPIIAKKSKLIITVSKYEQNQIKNNLRYTKQIEYIYNGVGSNFKIIEDENKLNLTMAKYNLPDKFLLFFGNQDPKKNTRNVLKAFALLNEKYNKKYKIVILDLNIVELKKILKDLNHVDLIEHIILIGYVPNTEIPYIMNLCEVFLYPSLRESFGIPILEAMSCGKPVITSNTSSMPEIAGNCAVFTNPNDPIDILNSILRIIENEEYKKEIVRKGLLKSSEYSWEKMTRNYLKQYKLIYQDIKKQ